MARARTDEPVELLNVQRGQYKKEELVRPLSSLTAHANACNAAACRQRHPSFWSILARFRLTNVMQRKNTATSRKSSVSRLALGLKKGEASGRDGWRKEFHAAETCFSCRKPFKAVTRQRHHCGRWGTAGGTRAHVWAAAHDGVFFCVLV